MSLVRNKSVNRKVKQLLTEKKVKQTELAEEMGMQPQVLSNKLTGLRRFTLRDISRIADYFDVSTDWLLGRTEQQKLPEKAGK